MRRGYFKPDIVSDLKFRSKCMFLRRAPQGDYWESLSASRRHFQATNASKTFGGRAPPGPAELGELKSSPRPPSRTCGRFAARVSASRPWRQGAICRGSSCQNDCLAAGLRQDLLSELRCFPDLIFRPQHHQKGLAAGLRRTRWGSLSAPPGPLAQLVQWKGTL